MNVYVKWLEAAGLRVAPIPYDLPEAEQRARFDGVAAPADAILGDVGGAWPVVEHVVDCMAGCRAVYQHLSQVVATA